MTVADMLSISSARLSRFTPASAARMDRFRTVEIERKSDYHGAHAVFGCEKSDAVDCVAHGLRSVHGQRRREYSADVAHREPDAL